jgi:arginyl-tRNA synthetase
MEDSLARLMESRGPGRLAAKYYFNDGGNQIRLLAESVAARYASSTRTSGPSRTPTALYRGEYVAEIARDFAEKRGDRYLKMAQEQALPEIGAFATSWCMDDIKKTLAVRG